MFSGLFPLTGRDTQWTVSPGQLGQTPAGELGRCGDDFWMAGRQAQGNEAGFMGMGRVEVQAEPQLWRRGAEGQWCRGVFSEQKSLCDTQIRRSELPGNANVHLFLLLSPQDYPDALITNYYVRADTSAASSSFLSPEVPGTGVPPDTEIPQLGLLSHSHMGTILREALTQLCNVFFSVEAGVRPGKAGSLGSGDGGSPPTFTFSLL